MSDRVEEEWDGARGVKGVGKEWDGRLKAGEW